MGPYTDRPRCLKHIISEITRIFLDTRTVYVTRLHRMLLVEYQELLLVFPHLQFDVFTFPLNGGFQNNWTRFTKNKSTDFFFHSRCNSTCSPAITSLHYFFVISINPARSIASIYSLTDPIDMSSVTGVTTYANFHSLLFVVTLPYSALTAL
jgi:hypothetical protein